VGAQVVSVQIGRPQERDLPLPSGRPGPPLRSAIWKQPLHGPVRIGRLGAWGDAVADTDNHGGPDKALCVYPADHLPRWSAHLGVEMTPGAFGENLSVSGLDESEAAIGDVYEIGTVTVEVSQPRSPCAKLARRWGVHDMVLQVRSSGRSGWYVRVLREGELEAGQPVVLVDRPNPTWCIARCNAVTWGLHGAAHRDPALVEAAREGAELPALSAEWRGMLRHVARA
jgi:MOSC domain-containing protein YiiM